MLLSFKTELKPNNRQVTLNKWFITIKHEIDKPTVADTRPTVGVDVGIKSLAVTSDGKIFENPKAYLRTRLRLKRLQRGVSRKVKGSKNRAKAVSKLVKLHARVANIRKNAIHKLTHHLAKNHGIVKIEDLSIKAFLKNYKLAGAIADCGMYEFRRQLEYKTEKFSSHLETVLKQEANSKPLTVNPVQDLHKFYRVVSKLTGYFYEY
jgi:putative transposase